MFDLGAAAIIFSARCFRAAQSSPSRDLRPHWPLLSRRYRHHRDLRRHHSCRRRRGRIRRPRRPSPSLQAHRRQRRHQDPRLPRRPQRHRLRPGLRRRHPHLASHVGAHRPRLCANPARLRRHAPARHHLLLAHHAAYGRQHRRLAVATPHHRLVHPDRRHRRRHEPVLRRAHRGRNRLRRTPALRHLPLHHPRRPHRRPPQPRQP